MILPCDNHAEDSAVILLTNLEDGSTATFCGECLVSWAQMLVQGLDQDAAAAAADDLDAQEAGQPESDQPAPDPERFLSDQAEETATEPAEGQAESVEPTPAASD